jgi:hypothetical protein
MGIWGAIAITGICLTVLSSRFKAFSSSIPSDTPNRSKRDYIRKWDLQKRRKHVSWEEDSELCLLPSTKRIRTQDGLENNNPTFGPDTLSRLVKRRQKEKTERVEIKDINKILGQEKEKWINDFGIWDVSRTWK